MRKEMNPRKARKQESKKCETCGGSKSYIADDYFIRKCWCDEVRDEERDQDEEY